MELKNDLLIPYSLLQWWGNGTSLPDVFSTQAWKALIGKDFFAFNDVP